MIVSIDSRGGTVLHRLIEGETRIETDEHRKKTKFRRVESHPIQTPFASESGWAGCTTLGSDSDSSSILTAHSSARQLRLYDLSTSTVTWKAATHRYPTNIDGFRPSGSAASLICATEMNEVRDQSLKYVIVHV